MKLITGVFLLLILWSCSQSPAEEVKVKKEFEMYKTSEMASLMRQMHHINLQLKDKINAGEDLGDFPESFEQILVASMTDNKAMDDFFNSHATSFLESQRKIYDNPSQAKNLFNEAVELCIACHQVKCAGPIPKIEKLYIKN